MLTKHEVKRLNDYIRHRIAALRQGIKTTSDSLTVERLRGELAAYEDVLKRTENYEDE